MKVLLLDIETAPNTAYVWGLWDQNITPDKLIESSYTLCWAAKWLGSDVMNFASCQRMSMRRMLKGVHRLLDEADVVVHYNGQKFDIPVLNKEFVKQRFLPPSPYRQVDLKQVAARVFRFESNKLDYVAGALELGQKVKHAGFQLWVRCMQGDPQAWAEMEEYNRGDVELLDKLYPRLLPWIPGHPNTSAFDGVECCPKCGSQRYQRRGVAVATTQTYQRFQCSDCGSWFRGTKSQNGRSARRMTHIGGA